MALQISGPYRVHYGPSVADLGDPKGFDATSLWDALYGAPGAYNLSFKASDVLRHGRGSGPLIGGCLSLLVSLLGTPYDPDYAGTILFWEDVGEPPYRIDRMLTQLRNAGKLDRLRGMLVGSLAGCEPLKGKPSLSLRQILLDRVAPFAFPVVWNVRAGHIPGKITLPLGAPATLSTSRRALAIEPPRAVRAVSKARSARR
jgi:muramoyltetrapeptide carboxypeptidase LdcA involved in peptidoglycan recycling